jgi:NAD(P)-dependent dehydrogenase (short-subunit alcohol dehydrogenase family)
VTAAGRLAGRVCLVTGASGGIGLETARGLAAQGARVVLACRDVARGEAARREISASTGNPDLEVALVDLGSRASTRSFAGAFRERHPALHVLVNNAGVWLERRRESAEGVELTWATNMLGYAHVARELLPLLRAGAPSRMVNVASQLARNLDLGDVEFRRRPYGSVTAYAQSKQANRMWTWALARRLAGSGVTANALHPGGVRTGLFAKGGGPLSWIAPLASRLFASKTPVEGADTVVWLASSPEVEGRSGGFYIDRREIRCRFRDEPAEERLFALCESMLGG